MKFKESKTVELKPSLSQINEILETISAFSNTEGGKIVVGVSDSGKVIGVEVGKGTIPELRKKAMNFITEHIKHGVFFDANRRYDKWEYPLRALEEALNNALAHRDYFSNAEIQLSVYDDRIEIWNPGELPESLTPEDLKRKHKSIPRNKLLADKLFLIKYIEQWGKGTSSRIKRR